MSSEEETFNLAPIQGKLTNTDSYLESMFDDDAEIIHNEPVPSKEEAELERKNAREEIAKLFLKSDSDQLIKPSSGEAMKKEILKDQGEANKRPALISQTAISDEPIPPSIPNMKMESTKSQENEMDKKVEYIVEAYNANLTLKDAEDNMELDDLEDDNLNEFLNENEDYEEHSGEDYSLGTKGSNIPEEVDGLVAVQHNHDSWIAYLKMLFEAEHLVLNPDYQNELENKFHERGLTERDVSMYCLGLKRERNLSVMKQIDSLVERLSTCLDSAVTVKTGMSSLLGKHEEMMERMFDTLRQTPSASSASVESAAPPPQRRIMNRANTGRGRGQHLNQKWELAGERQEAIKKQQPAQSAPIPKKDPPPAQNPPPPKKESSGALVIKGVPDKDVKPQELWKVKNPQQNPKKKGKASLTSDQEHVADLIGLPKAIYLAEKFLPYVAKILDLDTVERIKGVDPADYPNLKNVFMDLIWEDYSADHPEPAE
ncbi:TPA_asm: P [Betula betacytorhabdovirus 1]|nr:TPA_asm: P [Betula betacytorhabdovirus 1]